MQALRARAVRSDWARGRRRSVDRAWTQETREGRTREPLQSERGSTRRPRSSGRGADRRRRAGRPRHVRRRRLRTRSTRSSRTPASSCRATRCASAASRSARSPTSSWTTTANAVVTMKVDDDLAPLHDGTTATIRATSLSGIANRYVSLKPGPNSAQEIADGGQHRRRRHERAGRPRRALQHARREDARGPAQLHPRARATGTTARGAAGARRAPSTSRPFLEQLQRPDAASWRSTRRCSSAS